jgi:hypothetical protein
MSAHRIILGRPVRKEAKLPHTITMCGSKGSDDPKGSSALDFPIADHSTAFAGGLCFQSYLSCYLNFIKAVGDFVLPSL